MVFVASINRPKIPGSSDDFLIRFTGSGTRLEENQRFYVRPAAEQCGLLFMHRVRCHPDASLQAAKVTSLEDSPQPIARVIFGEREIECGQSPGAVPRPPPAGFRIASAQTMESPSFGQAKEALSTDCLVAN